MEAKTPLPPKRQYKIEQQPKHFKYADLLENNQIRIEDIYSVTISKDDLSLSMSYLENILKNKAIDINCKDFETVQFLDKFTKETIANSVYLLEDGLRISRENIDLTQLKHIDLIVPLKYLPWGIKFGDKVQTYSYSSKINDFGGMIYCGSSSNSNKFVEKKDLIKILKTIKNLANQNCQTAVDNVGLISDFIQSRTQFIDNYESETTRGTFITPDFETISDLKNGCVETILNKQYGVCEGIAALSMMLLNNPYINEEVEAIRGYDHAWNRILIDGKYYYFDNTWCITRSENPHESALITLSFSKKYLLFGEKTANQIGHHIPRENTLYSYNNGVLSKEDYGEINYQSRMSYRKEPLYKSFIRKK